jgi:hypothetical protein
LPGIFLRPFFFKDGLYFLQKKFFYVIYNIRKLFK